MRGWVCRLQLLLGPAGLMTTFYRLRFETPPTWRARSLYSYPPGTGWLGYTPRHWVVGRVNFYAVRVFRLSWVWVWVSCYDRRSVGQSASLSRNEAPIWGLRPDFYYCQTVAGLLMWNVLSDERTDLSFTNDVGPRQRSHSQVRVPWDSWLYFTISDSKTFLFVASYDSQCYGGGIWPRLHTGWLFD
jgi:hypothetical protein